MDDPSDTFDQQIAIKKLHSNPEKYHPAHPINTLQPQ